MTDVNNPPPDGLPGGFTRDAEARPQRRKESREGSDATRLTEDDRKWLLREMKIKWE